MAITGTWADGSPLLAIPNYARNNRPAPPGGGARSKLDQSRRLTVSG